MGWREGYERLRWLVVLSWPGSLLFLLPPRHNHFYAKECFREHVSIIRSHIQYLPYTPGVGGRYESRVILFHANQGIFIT